jgi:2-polyprenyl-6-hydroxyphenyl methylase / 3-demethylubiquinone-9 3-methyltransferase
LNTIDKKEIEKFSKLAKDWWNPNGKFKPLHLFNPTRIKYIKEKLSSHFNLDPKSPQPLKNISILDIGCGGGLLCEPLKRLGATITGIDASKKNIEIAKLHAKEMDLNINYIFGATESLKFKKKFDVILNMEIVEHVSNVEIFIENCSKLIEGNGMMFVATINKNLKSYLFAILGAEYILRWLPIGTHDWNKFLPPNELEEISNKKGFKVDQTIGVNFNLLSNKWSTSNDASVNYISTFIKN